MKNKLILFLSAITLSVATATALPTSSYSTHSKLASGKWVKIRTTQEGIYQLSYEQLAQLGLDPAKVQVYGYGGVALTATNSQFNSDFPDDIVPVATRHTDDGRILFFGQGDAYIRSKYSEKSNNFTKVRNPYDTASYYFLSDYADVQDIPGVPRVNASGSYNPLKSHIYIDFIEKELQSPSNGGAFFHGPSRDAASTVDYTFTIRDFMPTNNVSTGSFYYSYGIKSPSSMTLSTILPEGLTSSSVYNSAAYGLSDGITAFTDAYGYVDFKYPDATGNETKDFTFSVKIPAGNPSYCAEDYVMLRYPRANRLSEGNPFLVMNFPNSESYSGQKVVFEGVDKDDLEVWGIDGYTPVAYTTDFTNGASVVLDGKTFSAVAFCPSMRFAEPEIVGDIENQDLHGEKTPDMLIITVADQEEQALELAALHKQYQGMDVLVVVHDRIFNEFSSGTRDAMAYRRIAKMFYDRDPQKFRYLLLMGPVYYDNRCVLGDWIDRILCYEQDDPDLARSTVTNYATDAYFAMLSDNYKHRSIQYERTQINVGRVSSLNAGRAAIYVNKVRDRFENPLPAEVFNHVVLLAGTGDNTKHSRQANEVISGVRTGEFTFNGYKFNISEPNETMSFSPIYGEGYSPSNQNAYQNAVIAGLNRGAGMMTYIGHGSPTSIYGWGISNVNSTRYTYAPFVLFSSCDQYAFDHSSNGLTDTMMFTEEGGCLGGIAAVRSVYIEQNQMTTVPVSVAFATAGADATFGDVFRRSRDIALDMLDQNSNAFYSKSTTFCNILAYNLAGDPALPVGVPGYSVTLEEKAQLKPYETTTFAGSVTRDGKTDPTYNGSVRIEVLDGLHSSQTYNYNNESSYNPNTVNFDNEVLATGFGTVKNGKFTVDMAVPLPAFPADTYRVVVSTSSDGGNGIGLSSVTISEFNSDEFDEDGFSAPTIKEFYADDPSFTTGDEISASSTLYALIDPSESGLNTMTGNVNTRTRITVDGTSSINNLEGFLTRTDDGMMRLVMPMKQLSDGSHIIELCVANNAGLVTRESIEVIATHRSLQPEITVAEAPASTVATIDISEKVDYSHLLVADSTGNTIFSVENPTFPYKWNLCDKDGNAVGDGLYKVSVLVQNDRDFGSTAAASIIVLR